ncbi:hypothetical protein PTTW11_11318 [Pyrenophora teres f. teres]|uniref:Uncharacterized protein n=1 Tax=Pyrenophora teres f. teres TaxID=97479 RepID=A0A6S6WFX3_9PLEO|nr:hypothetical protein HRS9122_08314 [Pyrenophora teres f. teres]CAE7220490.1 hypothetical protein PTTW11_11318 [Pyrenophora teres f. teres]
MRSTIVSAVFAVLLASKQVLADAPVQVCTGPPVQGYTNAEPNWCETKPGNQGHMYCMQGITKTPDLDCSPPFDIPRYGLAYSGSKSKVDQQDCTVGSLTGKAWCAY